MHFLHESHPCDSLSEQLSVAATGCSEVLEPLGATLVVHCERTKSCCSAAGINEQKPKKLWKCFLDGVDYKKGQY